MRPGTQLAAVVAVLLGLLAFAYFVWPTRYDGGRDCRRDRLTGKWEVHSNTRGWEPLFELSFPSSMDPESFIRATR
jgi:hypothetical protein